MTMQYRPISLLRKIVRDDMVASPAGCTKRFVLGQLIPAAPARNTLLLLPTGTEYHVGHEQNTPTMPRREPFGSLGQTDVLLREEPDEEEDDEEDEGNVTGDEGDDDEEDDGGYSVQVCRLCQW